MTPAELDQVQMVLDAFVRGRAHPKHLPMDAIYIWPDDGNCNRLWMIGFGEIAETGPKGLRVRLPGRNTTAVTARPRAVVEMLARTVGVDPETLDWPAAIAYPIHDGYSMTMLGPLGLAAWRAGLMARA